jgi:hypothetical protein
MSNKILAIYDNSDTGICEFSETAELARIHGDEMHITETGHDLSSNYIVLYLGTKPTIGQIRKELGF